MFKVLGEEGDWACSRCRANCTATQKFDLWSLPDTFVIHLRRDSSTGFRVRSADEFSSSSYGSGSDELRDLPIEVPVTRLDLRHRCHRTGPGGTVGPDGAVYDLYGVVNHYGTAHFGHCTALIKNADSLPGPVTGPTPDATNRGWYVHDDSSVYPTATPAKPADAAHSHLLFYQRRATASRCRSRFRCSCHSNSDATDPQCNRGIASNGRSTFACAGRRRYS